SDGNPEIAGDGLVMTFGRFLCVLHIEEPVVQKSKRLRAFMGVYGTGIVTCFNIDTHELDKVQSMSITLTLYRFNQVPSDTATKTVPGSNVASLMTTVFCGPCATGAYTLKLAADIVPGGNADTPHVVKEESSPPYALNCKDRLPNYTGLSENDARTSIVQDG